MRDCYSVVCGVWDVAWLGRETLRDAVVPDGQFDVAMLMGKATLAGADVFAEAMRDGVARTYVPIGGAGHTTETFRARASFSRRPALPTMPARPRSLTPTCVSGSRRRHCAPRSSPLRKAKPRQRRTKPRTFRNERLRDFAKQSDLSRSPRPPSPANKMCRTRVT